MKVKPVDLARVLKKTQAAISLAASRGKLNKTLDGLIDLDDAINHNWIVKRLSKLPNYKQQGCEIPQKISALFEATPLTANEKSKGNAEATPPPAPTAPDAAVSAPEPDEVERDRAARLIADTQRTLDKAKAEEAKAKAEIAQIKAANMRRELIQINPFARLLFNILAAVRTKILSAVPNIAQRMLDEIKSALTDEKTDTEILMLIKDIWHDELAKIFTEGDKEMKNKVRQAKNDLAVLDDEETEIVDAA
jgi:phage terminase Nu1 subunit (DNA packaging protein)